MYDADRNYLKLLEMEDAVAPAGCDLAMQMPVHDRVTNPRGGLQGGLLATLVDVTAGKAANKVIGEGKAAPTADLTIHFLSPITVGPAVAQARVVRGGRTRVVVQVDVRDAGRDVLAATATLSFAVLEARPGQSG